MEKLWCEAPEPARPELEDEDYELEEALTGEDIRRTSASFKKRTSVVDGVHPKQISWMSEEAWEASARFMSLVEAAGDYPQKARSFQVPLLSKDPSPGVRPIGVFRGLLRVHGRARRSVWRKWESIC